MMAGAGGAMRATGWRATAIRFQQFGEGGSYGIARLAERRARGQRRACEIDLRGARPAPAACAALCVAMDGRRQPTSMVCWCRSDGGEDWRRAGDDGRNAPRRDQHDTRRHPATSVSFWDGDR